MQSLAIHYRLSFFYFFYYAIVGAFMPFWIWKIKALIIRKLGFYLRLRLSPDFLRHLFGGGLQTNPGNACCWCV